MSEREQLEQAIAALEGQRAILGDAVVNLALAPLREKLAALEVKPPVEEQRKLVTVLFADVSGFTAMSETMDPEEVGEVMNQLWNALDAAITAHGGSIDKHIGDAVMALWGGHTAREDDAERAIHAALAMQQELSHFGSRLQSLPLSLSLRRQAPGARASTPLSMRIGINTGMALLGVFGTTGEYTAMGDTVNLASRLEDAAPVGGILISHDTYRHVRGIFDVQAMNPITVKGKAEPVQTYVVKRAKPRAFRMARRGVEGVETPTVGRERELDQLRAAFMAARDGQTLQAVTIIGEAGIGKSRLLEEFEHWIEVGPWQFWYFKARADENTTGLPYAMLRDLLSFRFRIQDSDLPLVALERLERGFADVLGAVGHEAAHFVGHLIGLDLARSPYLQGILNDPSQIRAGAFYRLGQFLRRMAQSRPIVILLDDLHWADDETLELLETVIGDCQDTPILVLGLARPALYERRPTWGQQFGAFTRLDLQPLSTDDSRRLVSEILRQVGDIPVALQELIVSGAEGNPFYVEELIKMLIDDGVIVKGEERWWVARERLNSVRVPPTLTGVLQARLDGLPPPERETLKRASVVGQIFWDEAVAHLSPAPGQTPPRPMAALSPTSALDTLRRREMVFNRPVSQFAGAREYTFKHAILRDVTYESVLLRQRRAYHALAARWLIERSGERAAEYAGLIAEHFERASEAHEAATWYTKAGAQAQMAYAPEKAIDYYNKALSLFDRAEGASHLVELFEGLSRVLELQARYTEALDAYSAMRAAAEEGGDRVAQARALNGLSFVLEKQGDYARSIECARDAEALVRDALDNDAVAVRAHALYRQGWALYRQGDIEAALDLCKRSMTLSMALRDRRELAAGYNLLGAVNLLRGEHVLSVQNKEAALALYREVGDRRMTGVALNNLGSNAFARGDYGTAASLFEAALKDAREIGHRELEMWCLSSLGAALVELGDYTTAEARLRQAIEMGVKAGQRVSLSHAHQNLAGALLGQDRLEEAAETTQRVLTMAQEMGLRDVMGEAWRTLGKIALRAASPRVQPLHHALPNPAACFAESLQIFTTLKIDAERARTLRAWGQYELRLGAPDRGAELWQAARDIFGRLGLTHELERMADLPGRD